MNDQQDRWIRRGARRTLRLRHRLILFAIVFCIVLLWVAASGRDDDAAARSFLRNLMRALF